VVKWQWTAFTHCVSKIKGQVFFYKQNNSLARKANEGSLLPVDGE